MKNYQPSSKMSEVTIALSSTSQYAYTLDEKENMLRLALTARRTPWLTTFRIGAPCAGGKIIEWFPCAMLISAVFRSRRIAMEYRSWRPDATPNFGRKEARQCFDELIQGAEAGAWISQNRAGILSSDMFVRSSQADCEPDNEKNVETVPEYFPANATVSSLDAARTLRVFFRTGQRAQHVSWTATHNTAIPDLEPNPMDATIPATADPGSLQLDGAEVSNDPQLRSRTRRTA